MIRATTGGVMKTYRSNLMNSFINMNANRNTVLSQRIFNSFAEDPATAARAFRLRKSRMMVESQHDICTDVMKKYETAFSCLQANDDVLCTKEGVYGESLKTLTGTTLKMLNDPTGDARTQLTKVLDQMSQTLVQTMNQKYGDIFIFAGADGHNVPFEIVNNKLYYRGIWVDTPNPNVLKNGDDLVTVDENGNVIDPDTIPDGDPVYYLNADNLMFLTTEQYDELYNNPPKVATDANGFPIKCDSMGRTEDEEGYDGVGGYYLLEDDNGKPAGPISVEDYFEAKARADNPPQQLKEGGTPYTVEINGKEYNVYVDGNLKDQVITKEAYDALKREGEKLDYLANEKYFVDIGYGFQEDDKGKLIESSAFNAALNGIKFLGYGTDKDGDPKNLYSLVQKLRQVAESVGPDDDWSDETWDEFNRLVGKFESGISNYQTQFANLAASTTKLENQKELLEDNFYNLQEQYSDLEDVDMVDAITSFIWAEYCYNAALKVGNSILSESLMDYLN